MDILKFMSCHEKKLLTENKNSPLALGISEGNLAEAAIGHNSISGEGGSLLADKRHTARTEKEEITNDRRKKLRGNDSRGLDNLYRYPRRL